MIQNSIYGHRIRNHKKPWNLPYEWSWSPLGDYTGIIMGQSPPGKSYNSSGEGLPFFQGKAEFGDIFPTPIKWCKEPRKIAEKGDVLISVRAPVGPTNLTNERCCIGRGLAAIRPKEALDTNYLLYALRALERILSKQGTGSTFSAIGRNVLMEFTIPLPYPKDIKRSLDVQSRIVVRIESLLSEVKEAQNLLEKMQKDAGLVMEAALHEMFSCIGTTSFGEIVESYKNGIYKPKEHYGTGYPSIRMFNIQDGLVNSNNAPLLEVTPNELETYGLLVNDILINRVNSRELVGKAGLVPDGLGPCTFESKNIRARVKRDKAEPSFIVFGLNSKMVREQMLRMQKPAIGQATINQTNLNNLKIPFLSDKKKQKKYAERLNYIREELGQLKLSFLKDMRLLEQLKRSILDRAFRGEL